MVEQNSGQLNHFLITLAVWLSQMTQSGRLDEPLTSLLNADEILSGADQGDVVFLVVGDPLG